MDGLSPILLLLVWSVLSAIAGAVRNKKMKQNRPGQGPGPGTGEAGEGPPQNLLERLEEMRRQAHQQMLEEMGVETPEEIAMRKLEEQRRIAEAKAERKRQQASQSAIEMQESMEVPLMGERPSVQELAAEVDIPRPVVTSLAARTKQPSTRLARNLIDDLQGGKESLRRAVLLSEILGPPPGLAGPGRAGEPTSRPWR